MVASAVDGSASGPERIQDQIKEFNGE